RQLDNGAVGSKIAAQHRDARVLLEWLPKGMNHRTIPTRGHGNVVPHGAPVNCKTISVEHACLAEFTKHGRQAPCIEEILHQMLAGGLDVHQAWHSVSQSVEIIEA